MITDFCCSEYEHCTACPRVCGINRNTGKRGLCGETAELRIAWAGLHFGEEPLVTGTGGSGTIFITGCNLRCSFCQNFQISQCGMGRTVTLEEFIGICRRLETTGAENINIVTGSHAIPALRYGLREAKLQGLTIPIVWNSSAYETEHEIRSLHGIVDGWLPDLKMLDSELAQSLFAAPDYPVIAQKAILTMAALSPLVLKNNAHYEKMVSGVIVRHLALPDKIECSQAVLQWFAKQLKNRALLSLMTQYTPVNAHPAAHTVQQFPNRLLRKTEDIQLRTLLNKYKIDNGFYQELVEETDWLPDFNRIQTFSSVLSKPVWHWKYGFTVQS